MQQCKELTKIELFTIQFEKKLHLDIDTSARPVKQALKRVPLAMEPNLKEKLTRLEKIGRYEASRHANGLGVEPSHSEET